MLAGNNSAEARGIRLRIVRQLANLSTEELARLAGFSRASISYWENAKNSGLPQKGAEKIVAVMAQQGIACSLSWLLLGLGESPLTTRSEPTPLATPQPAATTIAHTDPPATLTHAAEMALFQQQPQAVVVEITHEFMQPLYRTGDWVGGNWLTPADNFIGESCIINLGGQLEVRLLKKSLLPNHFNLAFLTYSADMVEPYQIHNQALMTIAPITRVWRQYR